MQTIQFYQTALSQHLDSFKKFGEPNNLYQPIAYILELGGKRLRPVLTLLVADIFGNNYKNALNAALSVEVFHNFSLIHDDIMDEAPLRRGKDTVHTKWDINTGILSGDAMLILSYQLLEHYEPAKFKELVELFSKTAIQVCEGQQYDIDFETRNDVSIPEYLKMIKYKTAVLIGTAMKMGAIVADASADDQDLIYQFGTNLGIAFQLQDDYLDAYGDADTFGKQVGGDIIENKKTYLYLKALELLNAEQKETLIDLYNNHAFENDYKIEKVTSLFEKSGSKAATKDAIQLYTEKAFSVLDELNLQQDQKMFLHELGLQLMNRKM